MYISMILNEFSSCFEINLLTKMFHEMFLGVKMFKILFCYLFLKFAL